jgi:hypothetical protein
MSNSNRTDEFIAPRLPVDEKGKPLEMPPEFLEAGEEEPVYERAQLNQNLWHHYAVR